jgi:anti-sigma B factor antagonist
VLEPPFDQHDDLNTLSVSRREADGAVVVRVAGEIDMYTGPQVQEAIGESLREVAVRSVVIDLNGVTFFSSVGLATLVNAVKQADELHKGLRIVVGANRVVRRPLEATGMDIALGVCER